MLALNLEFKSEATEILLIAGCQATVSYHKALVWTESIKQVHTVTISLMRYTKNGYTFISHEAQLLKIKYDFFSIFFLINTVKDLKFHTKIKLLSYSITCRG